MKHRGFPNVNRPNRPLNHIVGGQFEVDFKDYCHLFLLNGAYYTLYKLFWFGRRSDAEETGDMIHM